MKPINQLIFLIVLFLASCNPNGDKWINGQWVGVGYQLDSVESDTWSIDLEIDMENELFNIEYPSLECSGRWELIEYSDERAIFDELILDNTSICIERGIVILTKVDENHISFSYYTLDEEEVLAYSTLKRK
ncbi:hypothetical protein [Aquimarina sediminis]|uniref:hypothetical protein n=1 Tax=Aquimarina sediminis TaxID=2070536 RepID=UPI000CA08768|nr:hypothetical protein [Aquimarina sediminis]